MKCDRPICPLTFWLIGAGWILLSLFVGETELLCTLPPIAPQILIASLTTVLLVSYFLWSSLRIAVDSWPARNLILVHLTRFVGIYFLFLAAHGQLDARFAQTAGWGDIVIAIGAVVLVVANPGRTALLSWNALGLLDILLVVGNAVLLRAKDPEALSALTRLPLSFLPTMIVPLIIATHVILFVRLLRREPHDFTADPLAHTLPL